MSTRKTSEINSFRHLSSKTGTKRILQGMKNCLRAGGWRHRTPARILHNSARSPLVRCRKKLSGRRKMPSPAWLQVIPWICKGAGRRKSSSISIWRRLLAAQAEQAQATTHNRYSIHLTSSSCFLCAPARSRWRCRWSTIRASWRCSSNFCRLWFSSITYTDTSSSNTGIWLFFTHTKLLKTLQFYWFQ